MKTCSNCKKEFPETAAFFPKDIRKPSGLGPYCRFCCRANNKISRYKRKAKDNGMTLSEYLQYKLESRYGKLITGSLQKLHPDKDLESLFILGLIL